MKKALSFIALSFCIGIDAQTFAASMVIDNLYGPVTQNEIQTFITFMNGRTPAGDNIGNNWVYNSSGTDTEALGLMYEVSRDPTILNRMIYFADAALACRNNPVTGRVLFTGQRELAWPNKTTTAEDAMYSGSENGDIIGHIAYCAKLILQNPSLWNTQVGIGDTNGYGATYKARALTYIAECDQSCDFLTQNFIKNGKYYMPDTDAWAALGSKYQGNRGDPIPWNQQMMLNNGFQRLAECHQLLGDGSPRIAQYHDIVQTSIDWFMSDLTPHNYTVDGVTVYKWGYNVGRIDEDVGHGQYDIWGMFRARENGSYGVTDETMLGFANTIQHVVWNPDENNFFAYIGGYNRPDIGQDPSSYIDAAYTTLSEFLRDPDLYTLIATQNQGMAQSRPIYDAYILWEKNRLFSVPEPSAFVLLALALLVVAVKRRYAS